MRTTVGGASLVLCRVGMFAPPPVVRIEELARRVEHIHAGAGDATIREGESGDRFCVIADGAVEVTERRRFRRVEEVGDCCGPRRARRRALA